MTNPKPPAIFADHIRHGRGQILAVRQLDSGGGIADVKFADGSLRTIQLVQAYWLTDLRTLTPTPTKEKRAPRVKKTAAVA